MSSIFESIGTRGNQKYPLEQLLLRVNMSYIRHAHKWVQSPYVLGYADHVGFWWGMHGYINNLRGSSSSYTSYIPCKAMAQSTGIIFPSVLMPGLFDATWRSNNSQMCLYIFCMKNGGPDCNIRQSNIFQTETETSALFMNNALLHHSDIIHHCIPYFLNNSHRLCNKNQ